MDIIKAILPPGKHAMSFLSITNLSHSKTAGTLGGLATHSASETPCSIQRPGGANEIVFEHPLQLTISVITIISINQIT